MQITLTVPDTKADSLLDVLRHISYVEVQPCDTIYDEPSASEEGKISAEEFYEDLKEAIHEVNEAIAGRKKLQTLGEFLAEYKSRAHC
jgi:hypothetical protein